MTLKYRSMFSKNNVVKDIPNKQNESIRNSEANGQFASRFKSFMSSTTYTGLQAAPTTRSPNERSMTRKYDVFFCSRDELQ